MGKTAVAIELSGEERRELEGLAGRRRLRRAPFAFSALRVLGVLTAMLLALSEHSRSEKVFGPADNELKAARDDFQRLCAPCHGSSGKGDGPVGQTLKIRPADLTQITQRRGGIFPEALIFERISGLNMPASHGTREMPIWGDVFVEQAVGEGVSIDDAKKAAAQATERITRLVKYLQAIQVAK